MNKIILLSALFMTILSAAAQNTLVLTANGKTATATLEQNEATARLISLLQQGPITLSMTENGGFEKIGTLPEYLPASDVRQTAQSGDIMLYVGNVVCIFYGSNTWAYTKLGRINNMTSSEIKDFLAGNPAAVTLSVGSEAGLVEIEASKIESDKVYDMQGKLVLSRPLPPDLYIINGKKTLVK